MTGIHDVWIYLDIYLQQVMDSLQIVSENNAGQHPSPINQDESNIACFVW